ncbi:FKBP-type peptidyl-prolyl cis-trans isomerase [Zymobacter palmae]|uniref:Peptidyl-prolyl cis-trans isomerase n=1 Tax=Zymobacter palmae TaxID=33074 RepID=A0A348HHY7_9GAMM|nr:FKBP-type peptidyl-prolyl cis-trans isomerase [Zymobacter palmae]BBG31239.1 peptidylprolyl isomerase, FKBP-type [Zymobacter palmae]
MKKLLGIVAIGTAVALTGCQKTDNGQHTDTAKGTPVASMNEQEKASYALGVLMADNLKTELPTIQLNSFTAGLNDAYNGHSGMNAEESKTTFLNFQHKTYQETVDRNLKDGQDFADKFAKEDGAKKTDTGIAYKVLASGDANGPQPTDSSNVEVTYEGRHIDGKVFDSSKEPVAFNMSQVIPGWREVVKQMHVGDEWEAVIPANKAYGEQGTGEGTIGPNETLVFKIKLLKVADNAQH